MTVRILRCDKTIAGLFHLNDRCSACDRKVISRGHIRIYNIAEVDRSRHSIGTD